MNNIAKRIVALLLFCFLLISVMPISLYAEETTSENLLDNGGFETLDDAGNPLGWNPMGGDWKTSQHIFLEKSKVKEGANALKITTDVQGNPWCMTEVYGLIPGAQYEIAASINVTFSGEVGNRGVGFKVESYGDTSNNINPDTLMYSTNTLWVDFATTFTVPEGTKYIKLYARLFSNGTAYFDDIRLTQAAPPPAYSFSVDDIYLYPDFETGFARVLLDPYYENAGIEEDVRVDFSISDGENVLDSQNGVRMKDRSSVYSFSIDTLTVMKKPYKLQAVVKDRNGEIQQTFSQLIYKYPRPAWLLPDGRFQVPGEEPQVIHFAYHVEDPAWFPTAIEPGINVVQAPYWYSTMDDAKRESYLAELDKHGLKAIFSLYKNMKMAGAPENIDTTKYVVEKHKDDPRVYAWALMDEPLGGGITEEKLNLLDISYRAVRDIDDNHPVYLVDYSPAYIDETYKYCDVLVPDYYPVKSVQGLYNNIALVRDLVKDKKPFMYLGRAYQNGVGGDIPTPEFMRAWMYVAYERGAAGHGYFSFSNPLFTEDGKGRISLWDSHLWAPLVTYATQEAPELIDYFVNKKYETFNENYGNDSNTALVWYSWVKGNDVYLVVHNRGSAEVTTEVPLISNNGLVAIEGYTAEGVGMNQDKKTGNGVLRVTLKAEEPLMYKITPKNKPDFSKLSVSAFTDLEGYAWAQEAIETLYAKNMVTPSGEGKFAPGEKITRGDFAMYFMRTLGITGDSTELFADVSADSPYAAEIAAGKALGILQGIGENQYNPTAEITRQDMMTIVLRGLEKVGKSITTDPAALDTFGDKEFVADYAKNAACAMVASGIIEGNENGNINPTANTTRAEAAVILQRVLRLGDASATPSAEESLEIEMEKFDFADTPSKTQLAVWNATADFLKKLNIVDNTFDVKKPISRAEAAKIFIKALGNAAADVSETGFSDVPVTSDYAKYIVAARDLKLMSGTGEGLFSPGKPMTYNQAVKVLVSMLGYGVYAENDGGYMTGYYQTAKQIDLLDGTENGREEYIRAGEFAVLLRNALDIDMVSKTSYGINAAEKYATDKGKTLLSSYFGLKKYTGRVTGNYYISMDGARLRSGQISLDGNVFEAGESGAEHYLGRDVNLYVKADSTNEIIDISPCKRVKVTVVQGKDILSATTKGRLAYSDSENRDFSVNIASNAVLVYNGAVQTSWDENDLKNINGTVTLIENSGVGADIIIAEHYVSKVVERVDPDDCTVFFTDQSEKKLDARASRLFLCDKDGKEIGIEEITADMVLSYTENTGDAAIKAVVSADTVSGLVEEQRESYIYIDKTRYPIAKNTLLGTSLAGETRLFRLDHYGQIVAYDTEASTRQYAYFTSINKDKGLSTDVKVRIFTANATMEILNLAEKVAFNGVLQDGSNTSRKTITVDRVKLAESPTLVTGDTWNGQLVVYKQNEAGEITELLTAIDSSAMEHDQRKNIFTYDFETGPGGDGEEARPTRYIAYGMKVIAERYRINKNTRVFLVPNTYSDKESDYAIRTNTYFDAAGDYYPNAMLYDVDENYYVSVVVQELNMSDTTNSTGLPTYYGVVQKVSEQLNADGEPTIGVTIINDRGIEDTIFYALEDYQNEVVNMAKTVFTDPEKETEMAEAGKVKSKIKLSALDVGDAVEYYKNNANLAVSITVHARANSLKTGEHILNVTRPGAYMTYSKFSQFCGYVEEVLDYGYTFTPNGYKRMMLMDGHPADPPIVLYEKEKGEVRMINLNQLKIGDLVYAVRVSPYQKIHLVVR
ncbi:MAG: S-layer homology domain-containing protein [Clostridia bacterium]|nr:S-layer homology domain-containing protein [Clostridia bacterium]